jgi:hypothetical protein
VVDRDAAAKVRVAAVMPRMTGVSLHGVAAGGTAAHQRGGTEQRDAAGNQSASS